MYRTMLILLLSLLFTSCATPQSPRPPKEEFGRPVVVGKMIVLHFPKGLTKQQVAFLTSASVIQLEAFEADFHRDSKPVHVWFSRGNGKSIPCGKLEGEFWGCHYGPNGPIWMFIDKYYSSIAFYHELIHHNVRDSGHAHGNPLWESHWEPRQDELRAKIRWRHRLIMSRTR